MALSAAEEAQLRDLIAQQAALLSLAGVEPTILSKLGATKVTLSGLPAASAINDADLLLLRQGTTDKSITGAIVKAANLESPIFTGDPRAPTPEQFDNDTSLATTAFVQRALGNLQGEQAYDTSQAITDSQVGKLINFSGAGVTLTLPNSANVTVGSVLTIYGNGFGGTIQKAAGDILLNGTFGSISSFNLVAHDKVNLVSIGVAGWYVIGGEVGLRSSSSFAASLATNGYQKLPSGLIIQWGTQNIPAATTTITLPIVYPTSHFIVIGSSVDNTGGSLECVEFLGRTNSQFQATVLNNAGAAVASRLSYVSIGY